MSNIRIPPTTKIVAFGQKFESSSFDQKFIFHKDEPQDGHVVVVVIVVVVVGVVAVVAVIVIVGVVIVVVIIVVVVVGVVVGVIIMNGVPN